MKKGKKKTFYDQIDRLLRNQVQGFVKRRRRDGDRRIAGMYTRRIRDGMIYILTAELNRTVREVVKNYEAGKQGRSDGK